MGSLSCRPLSKSFATAGRPFLLDLSSAATLCRNVIESYLVLVYLCSQPSSEEENDFQQVLWGYHEACERLKMMESAVSDSIHLSELNQIQADLKDRLINLQFFQQLPKDERLRLIDGQKFKLVKRLELCKIAGVSCQLHEAQYRYCSAFAHTAPFSISVLDAHGWRKSEFSLLFANICRHALAHLALAVHDYLKLHPDLDVDSDLRNLIAIWKGVLKWKEIPETGNSPTDENPSPHLILP